MHQWMSCNYTNYKKAKRYNQPRMSLLGKPLNYRHHRRDMRYRKLQSRVYNFLERPRGLRAIFYHVLVFFMVFTCLALSVFSTIKEYETDASYILIRMETLVVVWFIVEYFVRLWSAGCRSRYQGFAGRLKFMRQPFCIIDIVTIMASAVVLAMGTSGQVFAASALRGLRFFQILRMVRMDRRGGTWKLFGSVIYAHRQELITTIYIGFLGLIFGSFVVYIIEKDVNPSFNNFAQALWWGVITLCTVGYGDIIPATWQGKLIGSFCALLGISLFALPAGIIGSGLALKVQQQQRQKHMIRRLQPAATLIQAVWRCYASDEQSLSVATWRIHEMPYAPAISNITRNSSSVKSNSSIVSRLPSIRRQKQSAAQSTEDAVTMKLQRLNANGQKEAATLKELQTLEENIEDCQTPRFTKLTDQHKNAIRFLRKLKYFVARRKFKEALKPYDVKDVMEQYAAGHVDLLGRVKNVQKRLDLILGKHCVGSTKDKFSTAISLSTRVIKVEQHVHVIEEKLDLLLKAYMDDRYKILLMTEKSLPIGVPPLYNKRESDIFLDQRYYKAMQEIADENEMMVQKEIHETQNEALLHKKKKRVTIKYSPDDLLQAIADDHVDNADYVGNTQMKNSSKIPSCEVILVDETADIVSNHTRINRNIDNNGNCNEDREDSGTDGSDINEDANLLKSQKNNTMTSATNGRLI